MQVHLPTSMLQILLLEDDPVDHELIEATLKNNGIESNLIRVAYRQDFLKCLNTRLPDLILADYILPEFDGIAALELAKAICPEVPFILVSGVLGEEQAIDALKRGATDYVLKQRLERLIPAIQRTWRESQERQERQKVTKALKQTDDLLRAIVDASPVSIITLNRQQRVMTWNTTAEELYGWQAKAVIDHTLPLIPKAQQEYFDCCFSRTLENNRVSNQDFQHQKRDGSLIDVSLSLAPLHDADDNIYGVVMTTVDNTIRKQVEAQRLALLAQERAARTVAETANRVKDEFLAVLSHELRTPLNAIVGWIKLIQKGNLSPTILQRALDTIERNAAAQTQLIEDLLDISRIIRGQVSLNIQPVDVIALIQTTNDTLRPAAEAKSIQIKLDLVTPLDRILADPNRLQQVFWNLLSNAIKFTPPSGKVTVQINLIDSLLQIQVVDSGIGIAPDFLPYVFEYFRQADGSTTRSQGGLGLGLAITRHLVELHGGTIHVSSSGLGQGSTFTIILPMRVAQANNEFSQKQVESDLSLQGVKAIVVDDDIDARELMTFVLEQQGAKVKSAGNVQEALSLLNQFQPDVLISDIGMPDEDGYTFLQTIRSLPNYQLCNIPAVALTAYAREEDRQRALEVGYQTHLVKPFDPSEVITIIHQLAQHKLKS
ncbi:ATP-binding response regulator [Halotia branconii]|uniref:Circadian input-output histidine kinase CikA n=1 Tax=Halotia branconii CENA392 TaxID=1539056 RepID=A0AAJ6PB71_9CYAN|nr:response regulator [Halotia branconii]WGV27492.1 response regulator [Halotia branconii CENA392]